MKVLLALSLVLVLQTSYAQNAYYDAIQMANWSKLSDQDTVKTNNAKNILARMLKYGRSYKLRDSSAYPALFRIYNKADTLYSYTIRKGYSKKVIVDAVLSARVISVNKIQILKNRYLAAESEANDATQASKSFDTLFNNYKKIERGDTSQLVELAAIKDYFGKDTSAAMQSVTAFLNAPGSTLTDSLHNSDQQAKVNTLVTEKYLSIKKDADSKVDKKNSLETQIYDAVMQLSPKEFRSVVSQANIHVSNEDATLKQDIDKAKNLYTANDPNVIQSTFNNQLPLDYLSNNAGKMSDLNFPSQTDIIDALSIYITRRAKNEAVLLFIEQLAKFIHEDQLAQDMFPETWRVMQTEEIYHMPRFGVKWKTAIATDFINLPQNVIGSQFIQNRIQDTELRNYFADAVTFGVYASRKYNFIDITRTLFEDHSKIKGKYTRLGVDVLHIINQELFDSSAQRLWIAPQRFFMMDFQQLNLLYDLIKIKYQDTVGIELKNVFTLSERSPQKITQARRFFTDLLTVLQQFYEAQNGAVAAAGQNPVTKDGFWDTQRRLVDLLIEQNIMPLSYREKNALNLCKTGFFVYDYISNKNYIAAAEQVIKVIGTLTNMQPKGLINLTTRDMAYMQSFSKSHTLYAQLLKLNTDFNSFMLLHAIRDSLINQPADSFKITYIEQRFELGCIDSALKSRCCPVAAGSATKQQFLDGIDSLLKGTKDTIAAAYETIKKSYDALPAEIKKTISIKTSNYLFRKADNIGETLANAVLISRKENENYFKWFTDFSSMLTEIAMSRDSKTLATVIESYTLGAGSYRVKRNTNFSIDINSFLGAYWGWEKISTSGSGLKPVYGLTAPIGVGFSWGLSRKQKLWDEEAGTYISHKGRVKKYKQSSITLDLSFIDLAAVVSYRIANGEEKGLPQKVNWAQIISLGANVRWGIPHTPFCIGAGIQRTPELRSFNGDQQDAWRMNLSLTFDLPIFHLYDSGR